MEVEIPAETWIEVQKWALIWRKDPEDLLAEAWRWWHAKQAQPPKFCANERCEKLVPSERREGAIYCSVACANAQTQRAYRRRKRENA